MKYIRLSLSNSGSKSEMGFAIFSSLQLKRHIVSDDMKYKGRWFMIGLAFLWWRLTLDILFDKRKLELEPYEQTNTTTPSTPTNS